jgi:putative tricarboxylic transport membrane protein
MSIITVSRRLLQGLFAAAALIVISAFAQSFPSKPLELVVHTAPGGGTDIFARVVGEILTREKLVNQPVNIVNRPGGGGAIAYTYIKSKRGEPHTIMAVASLSLLTQTMRPELGLGLDNYTPLAFLAQDPQAVIVSGDSPYRTFKDLIEYENIWMGSTEYARHLAQRRVQMQEFLQAIGLAPKL